VYLAFVDVIAYEALDVAAEPFSDLQQQSFGLFVLGEFGRVAGVDEILQFAALHEFVSAYEVEVDLRPLRTGPAGTPERFTLTAGRIRLSSRHLIRSMFMSLNSPSVVCRVT
jgi:hypothetical protein